MVNPDILIRTTHKKKFKKNLENSEVRHFSFAPNIYKHPFCHTRANQNVRWTVSQVPLVPDVPVRINNFPEGSKNPTPKKCG